MPYYTAIVTLLAVAFYFFLATRVAVAHGKFNVKLPATTGNPDFERIFRVHVNTLEWMRFVQSTSTTSPPQYSALSGLAGVFGISPDIAKLWRSVCRGSSSNRPHASCCSPVRS
jgi:hypothetical protein